MDNMIKIDLIDDTSKIDVNVIDNTSNIDVSLTDYNDKEVRDDIEGLKQIKVDKIQGKGLSTNDFTDNEKNKLANLENYDDTEVRELIDTKQPRGNYLTQETDPTVPSHVKNITQNNITNWNNKADMSDIPDVSEFITKNVDNLTYYTLKTNTGSLIDLEINQTTYIVTLRLKNQDGTIISSDTIDLPLENVVVSGSYDETSKKIILTLQNGNTVDIPVGELISGLQSEITSSNKLASDLIDDSNSGNKFVSISEKTTWNSKYAKPNGGIPKSDLASDVQTSLGKADTAIQEHQDLSDYVTNTDYGSFATAGVIKASSTYGTQFASTGAMYAQTKTYEQYTDSTSPGLFIGKGTLENVIEGKGLITNDDLTDYVKNNDYATNTKGGVIKWNTNYGTNVDSNGSLRGTTKTYSEYDSMHDLGLISKVTLENVIEGKGLVNNSDYATFSKAGLVKPSSVVATDIVSSTGVLYASTLDYATYNSANNGAFVSKGTLENVITGKDLATKSDIPKYYYGTCKTGASTRVKVVECEDFVLEEGATISVYFTNAQTYNGYPYLNVNNTGSVAVLYKGGTAGIRYMWSAGEIIDFTYDGEYWICHGRALATTTYYGITKLSNSAISTSTSYALTPAVINAVAQNMITGYPAYSAAETYEVGDRVRYSSYSYECITAIPTAEAWTASHWRAIDPIQKQIDDLEARIRALES